MSTAVVGRRPAPFPLTEIQRKVVVALCRPLSRLGLRVAGHEPRDRRRGAPQRRRGQGAPARDLRALRARGPAAEPERARLAALALVNGLVQQHDF